MAAPAPVVPVPPRAPRPELDRLEHALLARIATPARLPPPLVDIWRLAAERVVLGRRDGLDHVVRQVVVALAAPLGPVAAAGVRGRRAGGGRERRHVTDPVRH